NVGKDAVGLGGEDLEQAGILHPQHRTLRFHDMTKAGQCGDLGRENLCRFIGRELLHGRWPPATCAAAPSHASCRSATIRITASMRIRSGLAWIPANSPTSQL